MQGDTSPANRAAGRRGLAVAFALGIAGLAAPAAAGTISNVAGSPYDLAAKACARQGKAVRPVSKQTDDKFTQVNVTITFECAPKVRAKPAAQTKRRPRR